ncbi:hypothetical protein [Parashewanella curva]|uniref:hypothetical protein n=1 Tax=Parashewanella curva TaxID=2338552 RepID=UPI00105A02BD|nr:hypothetical protein [Parashewanella curva]
MKFIFVDAENIGLQKVNSIKASLTDKVFVFSKNTSVIELCESKLFQVFSCYPTGTNQADFYIIGNLVGVLASLSDEQKKQCQFVLYSQDNALVLAFEFQCKLHKVSCTVALEPKSIAAIVPQAIPKEKASKAKILNYFKRPRLAESVRSMVQYTKPEFTRIFNEFIREELIVRDPNSKKKWILKESISQIG